MDDFYTYELAYPKSMGGTVFYVGKGHGDRIHDHERNARKGIQSHTCHVIRKIWQAGEDVVKRKIGENLSEDVAFREECRLIRLYGRENLTNKTDGGEGASGYRRPRGERVRTRVAINLGISQANGMLSLFTDYLVRHGVEPTDDNIKELAADLAYQGWHERLIRELGMSFSG